MYFLFFTDRYILSGIAFAGALALFPHASFMILVILLVYLVFFARARRQIGRVIAIGCISLLLNFNWLMAPLF
jgi:Ca2+/Na+ antiporter